MNTAVRFGQLIKLVCPNSPIKFWGPEVASQIKSIATEDRAVTHAMEDYFQSVRDLPKQMEFAGQNCRLLITGAADIARFKQDLKTIEAPSATTFWGKLGEWWQGKPTRAKVVARYAKQAETRTVLPKAASV